MVFLVAFINETIRRFLFTVVFDYIRILMLRHNGMGSIKVILISQTLMCISCRVPVALISGLMFSAHSVA